MDSTIARVATALLIDYSSVYYIDLKTGRYECYSTNPGYQKLELHSSGEDFFRDCQRDVLTVVYREDQAMVSDALRRESLLRQLREKDTLSIVYRLMIAGKPVYHTMRILRDPSDAEDSLILGVLNVDESVQAEQSTRTYNAIAKMLANRYATIYYVDLGSNHYVEYSSSNDYRELAVPQEGSGFFAETRKNVLRVIHPEDLDRVLTISDKLDMQFIRNAFRDRKDTRLLETMIQLAEAFEVPTIAEGVETAEQVFTLKAMGCDIIQGYYFSRPLPAPEFERFLLDNRPGSADVFLKTKRSRRDRFTYKAMHDPLTGLYNYTAFDILFHDSDQEHIAVLIAQIDGYEQIRQNHGRDCADRIVCRAAEVLRNSFRSVDHICRLRTDEFAVIMTRITSAEKELVLAKIDRANHILQTEAENMPAFSLSVGVAFSDREEPEGDIFQDADTALKRLKDRKQTGYGVF